jgi:uncharacterized Tic20 family protein
MEDITLSAAGKVKLPQPDEISKREKEDAMGAYLMMFAAWGIGLPLPFLSLIAAVIYHILNSKKSRFVAFHSFQSMITQSIVSVLNAALIIWLVVILFSKHIGFNSVFFIYLFFVIFWNLVYTVVSLIGCFKARKGKFYYFLVFGRMSFNRYYGKYAQLKQARQKQKAESNEPPPGF